MQNKVNLLHISLTVHGMSHSALHYMKCLGFENHEGRTLDIDKCAHSERNILQCQPEQC